ncbi:MAG: hypothetical protein V3V72_13510 [Ignavibacteriaceae bacterium]
MKESLEPVYRCDHCNKAMRSKGAMALHERMCKSNPKNDHKCFQYCVFLNKGIDNSNGSRYFDCGNVKSKFYSNDLYSYKLERFCFNQERISKMTRMPLKCDHYQIENGHEPFD